MAIHNLPHTCLSECPKGALKGRVNCLSKCPKGALKGQINAQKGHLRGRSIHHPLSHDLQVMIKSC